MTGFGLVLAVIGIFFVAGLVVGVFLVRGYPGNRGWQPSRPRAEDEKPPRRPGR